ncbi:MAG: HIRAN domain-containing protein [Clostridia bacterium]|nr:HIRAN domain-containing protein [Clostridia bacterium]
MENLFITVTGVNNYLGMKPFKIGRILKLIKDIDNQYDKDAIRVELPFIGAVGYTANSVHTVYQGTSSASRLYEKIGDKCYARVMFITHSSVIAQVLSDEEARSELLKQTELF